MSEIILKEESYELIGICMEIHRELGMGFKEIVYKDALEHELKTKGISYTREKKYKIEYKGIILPHSYNCRFYRVWINYIRGKSLLYDSKQLCETNNKLSESIRLTIRYYCQFWRVVICIKKSSILKLRTIRVIRAKKFVLWKLRKPNNKLTNG